MSEESPFGERKPGLLSRLFSTPVNSKQPSVKRIVKKTEQLKLTVPAARADAIQAAIEQWLAGRGIHAAVTREDAGDGKAHLKAQLGFEESAKLDLTDDAVQGELEKLLTKTAH